MPKLPKYINLDSKGCLCWETETYSPECCDPDDRYAEEMGGGRVEPTPTPIPEPTLGYGLLYNWYAATDVRGVAPDGFRVPSDTDIIALVTQLGGNSNTQYQDLVSTRAVPDAEPRWWDASDAGTNATGFNALPAGQRGDGISNAISQGLNTNFVMGSTNRELFAGIYMATYGIRLSSGSLDAREITIIGWMGFSIRCVSDTEPSTELVTDNDGNLYSWVQIGSQYWLQQSLKTTTYNNGDEIQGPLDDAAWTATTDGAWAYPNGDSNLPI